MKNLIALYDDHNQAISAIELLKENDFTSKHLSLLAHVSEDPEFKEGTDNANKALKGIGLGALAGTTVGLLAGVGLLAIPGLGFIVGAGAIAGAVAGFDFGVIGGTIFSALSIGGMPKDMEERYQKQLESGKTLVIVQGDEEELQKAEGLLKKNNPTLELDLL